MIHEILQVGPLQCNCSILGDERSREAIVVDPGGDIARILAVLARHALSLKQIVVTHAHIDHIAGAQQLKRITGAPVLYSRLDLPMVRIMDLQAAWVGLATPEVPLPDDSLEDGQALGVSGITGSILHTPGRTPGSISLYIPAAGILLAGDTLFAGGIGRTDLPGGDERLLLHSIHNRLLTLPESTVVVPGHGPNTVISVERSTNPFL